MNALDRELRRMAKLAGCPVNVRFAEADDLVRRDTFVVRLEDARCGLTQAAAGCGSLAEAFNAALANRDAALGMKAAA